MSAGVSDDFVGQAAGGELGVAVTDEVRALIRTALDEDLRYGPDVTTASTVPADAVVDAAIVSRAHGVIAGVPVVEAVFDEVIGAGEYTIGARVEDGSRVEPGTVVLSVHAPTRALLTAERTALNLISHMSGIATATEAWVSAVEETGAKIRDSRKTLPGMRHLQKYAVRAGGGVNHRMGLGDAALIKDNHVAAAGSVAAALRAVRDAAPGLPVEVEVDSLAQLDEVLELRPQLVLLDNFEPWETQMAVQRRNTRSPETKLESSGGLSLDVAIDYARTGVDYLAVGALTHSVTVLDLGLDIPAP
ncbi:carboxylating nicotinate-nucleotide diphosphorylase [Gordonia terrae]|uniref:Nicotinate-nucleotide pyrophosphorylase [carboxylating] n=1 Tax=Gordonia terrae TaxID=2055 RepID=A0AAD0KD04_9ACTN|nr:carboxylating nicotinate-nucleotide diphosphorylase [Gordonia terrae]ANY23955.1 nicotinate-nucleotide diphosphorylase (carboxylating) [Gordonia terrae]AWO84692.1 carboxylating nicotinate-nucleotide diphosphorylase [Gordonia terrae]VTR07582.1 nicotinate-nucleotide pyrophosphorylase [Clostridioides difficile]VTS56082.1 Nicotinate-nucleotide pyrophosphorylase [carboxylating] [Gordonia terrae]